MLHALEVIQRYKSGNSQQQHLHQEQQEPQWLQWLVAAEKPRINLERIHSIAELQKTHAVLDYTERTLHMLDGMQLSFWIRELLEEVLAWSETAKGGSLEQRRTWQQQGINLFVHNIGSAQLYQRYATDRDRENGLESVASPRQEIIRILISTHGLIGQYIRGEIPYAENLPLRALITEGWVTGGELRIMLMALNQCIIEAVDSGLWEQVQDEVEQIVDWIVSGTEHTDWSVKERLSRLRSNSIRQGEAIDETYAKLKQQFPVEQQLSSLASRTLWYVESAMRDFSLEEMVKVFLLALHSEEWEKKIEGHSKDSSVTSIRHISFEPLMNTMYYDYKGVKKLNIYKKRMIEKYLEQYSWEQISAGEQLSYPHLGHRIERYPDLPDTLFVTFEFSPAAEKLIAFCIEAEKSPLYEQAVLLLFDLFGLRRDAYDRFHNEETYLSDMNSSGDYKKVLLEHMVGKRVLDIGPGGGVLLDLIEQEKPEVEAIGIDISANVIEALERKKQRESHRWHVMKGDALQLDQYVEPGTVDTVIFSSILHELYSYIERDGRRFNTDTVAAALHSAFQVLSPGGRILIRDGIMSEPESQTRRIRFLETDGVSWLERYAADFKGREITFERITDDEVMMPINDAMEFLYTYTWGEEAYVHEVQEQFGVFTPQAYEKCIRDTLGEQADIIMLRHFLQEGYTEALADRIVFMDEKGEPVSLPDSTCLIVIEKKSRVDA
ncbi:class I SAM-dependent methyltransferase [Paenibacillus amylolyticus]|uniref:Class I SAM-dependent methyltransferase n=1 Tax=Paenibacillus amylolyticus TaxID=1451 RepID=A0A5M9WZ91_PAEAM|nr:class I SAM-dependent methyltransferase [Paenibacillus amylolyticus]KAA8786990.1 class I SAM-dependent methyltransferase [Paenibacillus amylolyticus]